MATKRQASIGSLLVQRHEAPGAMHAKKRQQPEGKSHKEEDETMNEDVSDSEDGGLPRDSLAPRRATKSQKAGEKMQDLARRLLRFNPREESAFEEGQHVPYQYLANALSNASQTTKRMEIAEILCNLFRVVAEKMMDDIVETSYLACNRVAPQFEGVELGLGDATIIKALAQTTGKKESAIKEEYAKKGDLGTVAAENRSKQATLVKKRTLTVKHVHSKLKEIAATTGQNAQERKRKHMEGLMVHATNLEAAFIVRHLQGKMRIGVAQQSVVAALAYAAALQEDASEQGLADRLRAAEDSMKEVLSECPTFDRVVPALFQHGPSRLKEHCGFELGSPLVPMLARPARGVSECMSQFGGEEFSCELKYDGERAQVHILEDGSAKVYSRNLEDHTGKFADVAAQAPSWLKDGVGSAVIDGEIVAFDPENKKILPFQSLSHRSRKERASDEEVQVQMFAFDCIFKGQEGSLLRRPLTERREALYSAVREDAQLLSFAKCRTGSDSSVLEEFLEEAIDAGTEGLIVKSLRTTYEPSKRSANWLKLKKDYLDSFGDTVDLVPIGAFHGRGKRAGSYGAFLLSCYDPDSEHFQSVCKIGTGFSEQGLEERTKELQQYARDKPREYFSYGENPSVLPDVWFEPCQVWEVKAADLSLSPVHCGAIGWVDEAKGIALRFPRFIRVREDKSVEQATSSQQLAELYHNQWSQQGTGQPPADEDEDGNASE